MSEKDYLLKTATEQHKIEGFVLIIKTENQIKEFKSGISELEFIGMLELVRTNFDMGKAIKATLDLKKELNEI